MPAIQEEKSFFFIPLYDPRLALKRGYFSWARKSDAIIFDLEDSLAISQKASGRELLKSCWSLFQNLQKTCLIRVNSEESELSLDMKAIGRLPNMIPLLTKVERVEQIERAAAMGSLQQLAVFIETPLGIINAEAIAAHPLVQMIFFGPEDLSLRLGVDPTVESMSYGAEKVINAGAAFKKRVIGCAGAFRFIGTEGLLAYEKVLRHSRSIGFNGAFAVHHSQIELINRVFNSTTGSISDIEMKVSQSSEHAVVVFKDELIGPPMRERYRKQLKNRRP